MTSFNFAQSIKKLVFNINFLYLKVIIRTQPNLLNTLGLNPNFLVGGRLNKLAIKA